MEEKKQIVKRFKREPACNEVFDGKRKSGNMK